MKSRHPWFPDPSWADPLIATLALLCLLGSLLVLRQRRPGPSSFEGPSFQGRVREVDLGAQVALGPPFRSGKAPTAKDLPRAADRAIAAVMLAEDGRMAEANALASAEPRPSRAFHRAFLAAYEEGPKPEAPMEDLRAELGEGLASRLLKARLAPPPEREALRRAALGAWIWRFVVLAALGFGMTILTLGGFITGGWLLFGRKPWPAPPSWEMSGRALLLVLLGWFTVYFLSALIVQSLAFVLSPLRPYVLPLGYALHAGMGVLLICRAEGLGWRDLVRRIFPGPPLRSLALAPPFLGLGLCAALAASLLLAPFLRGKAHPQQEIFEGLRQMKGVGPTVLLFITVAGIAPCFEELLMRGLLLGWLRKRKGPLMALAVSALVFGAVHLQPLALPSLSLLGAAFGLGVMRSGDLRTSILAHAFWNSGLFLLVRLLA